MIFENRFRETFFVDSGHVPMSNPFHDGGVHLLEGTDPEYGSLAGQGTTAFPRRMWTATDAWGIIYGAAVIDHDGSLLYSSSDIRPDGLRIKAGARGRHACGENRSGSAGLADLQCV